MTTNDAAPDPGPPPRACDPSCRLDPKGVCLRAGCRYDVAPVKP